MVIGNSGIQSHRVDSVNIGPDLICYTNVVNFKIFVPHTLRFFNVWQHKPEKTKSLSPSDAGLNLEL